MKYVHSFLAAGLLVGLSLAHSVHAAEPARGFHPGDTVVVTWTGSNVMLGDKELAPLTLGDRLKVTEVRGAWIGGWVELNGKQVGGWMQNPLLERGSTRRLSIERPEPATFEEQGYQSPPFSS